MKEVTPIELKQMFDSKEDIQVIDIREPYEADICTIGGELIPMGDVMANLDKIRKDTKVVMHCRSGGRSGALIQALERQGFENLYNLRGGILAWADEVDNALEKY